jgi:hypothetical protein
MSRIVSETRISLGPAKAQSRAARFTALPNRSPCFPAHAEPRAGGRRCQARTARPHPTTEPSCRTSPCRRSPPPHRRWPLRDTRGSAHPGRPLVQPLPTVTLGFVRAPVRRSDEPVKGHTDVEDHLAHADLFRPIVGTCRQRTEGAVGRSCVPGSGSVLNESLSRAGASPEGPAEDVSKRRASSRPACGRRV